MVESNMVGSYEMMWLTGLWATRARGVHPGHFSLMRLSKRPFETIYPRGNLI